MEIGIIAEGRGDCAVLQNILMGFLDLDEEDIRFLRPDFNVDNTDKTAFGSWTLVKKDCEEGFKLDTFLNSPIAGERYIIIQIDTAECELPNYDIKRPNKKEPTYCETLRNEVINKINEWLNNQFSENIFYAICIEEMEAWIHTIYENKDTSIPVNAKEAFEKYLNKQGRKDKKLDKQLNQLKHQKAFKQSKALSKAFQKLNTKKSQKVLDNNESLKAFIDSLAILKS